MVIDWMGSVLTLTGTVLVLAGLYRRDPAAQRAIRLLAGWVRARLLNQPAKVSTGGGSASLKIKATGEAYTPPLASDPGLTLSARVDRLEQNIEILSQSIRAQAAARRSGERRVDAQIRALRESFDVKVNDVHRTAREASIPERMEWWGLALLLVGAFLSVIGAIYPM